MGEYLEELAIIRTGKKFLRNFESLEKHQENFLNEKRMVFQTLSCDLFLEKIKVAGEHMSSNLLHDIHVMFELIYEPL